MPDFKKDNNTPILGYDPILFHNDERLFAIYKKIQAIVGAIFLTSNLIPDKEIIKTALREQSLTILDLIIKITSGLHIEMADLQRLSGRIHYLNSLLDIAFWSGFVSQMNSSLIQREINGVSQQVNNMLAKNKNALYLEPDFFTVPQTSVSDTKASMTYTKPPSNTIGQYKGQDYKGQSIKDKNDLNKPKVVRPRSDGSQSERRTSILNLLRERGGLGIKDFVSVIPGYSEKTIQRELLALVAEGVIKKAGERRWSTYSISQ